MRNVVDELEAVANTDRPALVEGERGTGREMIARVIHHAGPRRDLPFVAIEADMPLEPDGLGDSSWDALASAAGGTLLVKNILALAQASQRWLAKGLRETRPVDDAHVRVIGACDQDIESAVEAGVFDAELYEQMSCHQIRLPPLRDRVDDIPPLTRHFVTGYGREIGHRRIAVSTRAFERLVKYPWPGNVAELKDLSRSLVIRCRGARIEAGDVDALLPTVAERIPLEDMPFEDMVRVKIAAFLRRVEGYPVEGMYEDVIGRVERPLLSLVMEHTGGNQLKAAEILGVNRNTLRRKLEQYGIKSRTLRASAPGRIAAKTARAKKTR